MSGAGSGGKKTWSSEEKLEFMMQIISHGGPIKIPWESLDMPGRTVKSLQLKWDQIRQEASANRERIKKESEANAKANGSKETPTKPVPASPRSTRKRQRQNYSELLGDDDDDSEDEKVSVKRARLASDEDKTVIGSGSDGDNAVSTARNKPQAKTRGGSRGKPSTPVKKGIARRVKIEDTTDDDDPTFDGEV